MTDEERKRLLELTKFVKNELRYRNNNHKIPRSKPGFVRLLNTTFRTRDVIRIHLEERDNPNTPAKSSRAMADANPDMILTRNEAIAIGSTLYRTGEKCHNGHTGWRYVKGGQCAERECNRYRYENRVLKKE